MTMLAVERIKLFSTRSPWWCAAITLAITLGFAALMAGTVDDTALVSVGMAEFGYTFGQSVVMVLAALAVTTEYRFHTIKTTFLAHPHRGGALAAKTTVVAAVALVLGELAGFGSWALANLLRPEADLALNTTAEWINVAGIGPVYAFAAVLAVAVGLLVRHSAGAIALLMIYSLAGESLIRLIPNVGEDIYQWLPFNVAHKFVTGDGASRTVDRAGPPLSTSELSQPWALAYFAAITLVVLAIAIVTTNRRDA